MGEISGVLIGEACKDNSGKDGERITKY